MDISNFVKQYKNHPVLFVGTGLSLRYLVNSFSWEGLLKEIFFHCDDGERRYYDLKHRFSTDEGVDFSKIALYLDENFDDLTGESKNTYFGDIYELFYKNMKCFGRSSSKMKLYISKLLGELKYRESMKMEIAEFKNIRKNIGSVITTNYDRMIEDIFEFSPLIGNHILLSNPYGSVYKIHGCVSRPEEIIITAKDYEKFRTRYDLINAQLLSLFIHHPVIFIGYSINDDNVRKILKTIFSYVDVEGVRKDEISTNFLLVAHDEKSNSTEVVEHNMVLDTPTGSAIVRINKIQTNNFTAIYEALNGLNLPVSAMDVRKIQSVFKGISRGDGGRVIITEDFDKLRNSDRVLAIGSAEIMNYCFLTASEMMKNYFLIIEEREQKTVELIDKQIIRSDQYFPIFAFSSIYKKLHRAKELQQQQIKLVSSLIMKRDRRCRGSHTSIAAVYNDMTVLLSHKVVEVICSIILKRIDLMEVEKFLKTFENKVSTDYRKILCVYDLVKYAPKSSLELIINKSGLI